MTATRIDPTTRVRHIDGSDGDLAFTRGKVLLVVNTASKCGYTPQYDGLQALWRELGPRGLIVLGFPCDQFGHQEPDDDDGIAQFCKLRFGVDFPLFAKIEVNGAGAHPLFEQLKRGAPGLLGTEGIKWNFTKFLVDRAGLVRQRFAPNEPPEALRGAIEALLAEPEPTV